MIRNKWCDAVCVIVICFAVAVTVLFMNGDSIGLQAVHDEDAELNENDNDFTENDMNGDWDSSSAAKIILSDDGISINGDGAYELNGDLIIVKSGEYVISGELSDGSIIIDAEDNSKVWIQLNGVTLSADDDACFKVEQADKVFLTLADGSVNSMTGGEEMSDDALEDGVDGTIFAHDDLTINGTGSLTVTSGCNFGIAANDDLVITGGNISINAATSGIHVNDSLRIKDTILDITSGSDGLHAGKDILIAGGNITIDAGDDGIHSDEDVTVDDGTIIINKCYEGIEGKNITVNDGDIMIYPSDDGFNAADGSAFNAGFGMGQHMGPGQPESSPDSEASDSIPSVTINGGKITIINSTGQDADGIDSNGDIVINGGEVYISMVGSGTNCALDYGSESGGECLINGGTVIACGGSSMLEEISSSSAQCSIMYTTAAAGEDGTELILSDSEEHKLLSWAVPCSFTSAAISCASLEEGSTYIIETGKETDAIELIDTVTTAGSSVSESHDMGHGMPGGMQRQQPPPDMNSRADPDTVENTETTANENFNISDKQVYIFISTAVLVLGIAGALFYKKRR